MYGGIVNDNIVFPILDLIRQEIKDQYGLDHGIPSVILYRNHPLDDEIVTAAKLTYESGLVEEMILNRGSEDESTYPEGLKSRHPDYAYCKYWRLTSVMLSYFMHGEEALKKYVIDLNYDKKGLLASTELTRL